MVSCINKVDERKIFVFISHGSKDVNNTFIYFAENCNYNVLTCKKKVFDDCTDKGIRAFLLPEKPSQFKKAIKKIDIDFVVLAGDSYYGINNYLARNPSAFVQGITFNTVSFWEKRILWPDNFFYFWLNRCLGMTGKLFGKHKVMYNETLRDVCRAFVDKVAWGRRDKGFLHGNFSDLVLLQSEWEKEIFVKNGVPEQNIRIAGSICADWLVYSLKNDSSRVRSIYESCDLLFFSQPLYQYSGESRYLEELEMVVNECQKMELKLLIKLHPRDDVKIYKRFESDGCHLMQHDKGWQDADNVALIKRTKVVMGKGSTSMLIPLLMQKPMICLDLFDSDAAKLKYHLNWKLLLKRIEDFESMFAFASNSENQSVIQEQQGQLLARLGFFDGQCWKRIKDEIDKFLEESERSLCLQSL